MHLSIYKSFVRPHLDYAVVVYDQPNNVSFANKIETVQYNAILVITNVIKGTSEPPDKFSKSGGLIVSPF